MIPKRSGQRVTPVLRFVEGGQLSLERHRYSLGVDDPEAPLSAKRGRLPVTNQGKDAPLRGAMPGMKLGAGPGSARGLPWFRRMGLGRKVHAGSGVPSVVTGSLWTVPRP